MSIVQTHYPYSTPEPVAALPPVVDTIEVDGVLDLFGTSTAIVAGPAVRVPLNYLTGWRVTIAALNTIELAAGWTAKVWLSRVVSGVRVRLGSVTLTAVSGSPGVFSGIMSRALMASVGESPYQYDVALYDPNDSPAYMAVSPTDVTVISTGIPQDTPPTVEIDSPLAEATVLPGVTSVTFSYTGAVSFYAMLGGEILDSSVVPVTAANGVGSFAVNLTTLGVVTIGLRAISELGTGATVVANVTCAQPVVTVTSDDFDATIDERPIVVSGATTPALPSSTVLRIYDGATLIGTGTLAAPVTTSVLAAGVHSITGQVTTPAGAAVSAAHTVTTEAQMSIVTITSPVEGAEVRVTGVPLVMTVTIDIDHPSAEPSDLIVSASLDNYATSVLAVWQSGTTWQAELSVVDLGAVTVRARVYDLTPNALSGEATPVSAYVGIEYVGIVGSRLYSNGSVESSVRDYMIQTRHTAFASMRDIGVALANSYDLDIPSGSSVTHQAAVEYPRGTFHNLLFDGQLTKTVASGEIAYSDLLPISIPEGAVFWLRRRSSGGLLVFTFSKVWQIETDGDGDRVDATSINKIDTQEDLNISIPNCASFPAAIYGHTTRPAFGIVGDSRQANDPGYSDTLKDSGEVVVALGMSVPYLTLARGGGTYRGFDTDFPIRKELLRFCSHIIDAYGINDIDNAAADALSAVAKWSPKPVFHSTIAPKTSGAWSLEDGSDQTSVYNTVPLNTAIRAGLPGSAGAVDTTASITLIGDERKWHAGYTDDGLHHNAVGLAAVTHVDLTGVVVTSTAGLLLNDHLT